MKLEYRIEEDRIIIYGDTFRNKEKIKAIGASYDGYLKAWGIANTQENLKLVEKLCESCNKKVDIDEVFKDKLNASFPQFSKIKENASKKKAQLKQEELIPESEDEPVQDDAAVDLKDVREISGASGLSISELLSGIEQTIHGVYEYPLWVIGEVQNISFSKSGIFFELVEPGKNSGGVLAVKTCIWNWELPIIEKRAAISIRQFLKDGLKLRVCARVNFYKARSYINLEVKEIDPNYTKGDLALKRQELIRKLKKDGSYYKNKELSLSSFPLKVGLISSYKSRAYSDFLDQLHIGGYPGQVLFFDARVQGEDSTKDIIKGIDTLGSYGVDLIAIVRGGGSLSDLMWFDNEKLVYAVAESRVPVLAAIGHHDDQSVTEEVSYRREKTPTAAADFILSLIEDIKTGIQNLGEGIEEAFMELYERKIEDLHVKEQELSREFSAFILRCQLGLKSLEASLIQGGMSVFYGIDSKVEKWSYLIEQAWLMFITRQEAMLEKCLFSLEKIDPRPWMRQGYTKLQNNTKGKNVLSVEEVSVGDNLEARLIDGLLRLRVEEIKKIDTRG